MSMPMSAFNRLRILRDEDVGDCKRCGLCKTRTNIVFGVGDPNARVMFVGEAPGADEDRLGEPFVGRAGRLLDKMIGAMGVERKDVYIANTLKCRPPDNRNPDPSELFTCMPFLIGQISAIGPEVLVTLGLVATHALMPELKGQSMTRIHGKVHEWKDESRRLGPIKLVPTYHPAFLLRMPQGKSYAWKDLQVVMKIAGLSRISK